MTMHYLTYVFIPRAADISEAVATALRPFDDTLQVKPWKRRLEAAEIAAMAKFYRLRRNALHQLAEKMVDWNGGVGGVDEHGLYALLTHNPNGQWAWYELGRNDSLGWRDQALLARTLLHSPQLNQLLPHDFLTPDGVWHTQERYVSTGWYQGHSVHKSERQWLKEFKRSLATWPHHRVVCVTRHC